MASSALAPPPRREMNECDYPSRLDRQPIRKEYNAWLRRKEMTLCIAALAEAQETSPYIVACMDFMVSTEEFSSETEFKFRFLNDQVMCLISGSPGRGKHLGLMLREYLKKDRLQAGSIVEQITEIVNRFKASIANGYIGRRLGISYSEFLNNGKKWFGEDLYNRYLSDIDKNPLNLHMIIAGFVGALPVLCEIRDGVVEWKTTYAMVGVGAYTAEPALHARKQAANATLHQAVYNVYEAKRMGENSPYVGKNTSLFVISGPEPITVRSWSDTGKVCIEALFDAFGPKPMSTPPKLPSNFLSDPIKPN
jgi:hypothetical protein